MARKDRSGEASRQAGERGIIIRSAVCWSAMPLLPKEADLFPEELFAMPPDSWPWHVAHVRSRQEKSLARFLMEQQVPFYLPQVERIAERSSRRFRSYLPLFTGYVFFRGTDRALSLVLRSGVTANVIAVGDQSLLTTELEQIRRLQLAGASFEVYEDLQPADMVTITEGPFRGYTGAVVRGGRGQRLVVSLSMLRKNVAVEFERPVLRRARR